MSDSVRPHRRQPARLPRPWDSPGKNTGLSCHFLLECMKVKSESEVAQLCPTQRPHELQPTRLLRPWDFPGKSTGVGCHCLLRSVTQSRPTFCNPMDCRTLGFPVHHHLLELAQIHVHPVGDAIQPSHPLLFPSPPAPNPSQHQGLFQ